MENLGTKNILHIDDDANINQLINHLIHSKNANGFNIEWKPSLSEGIPYALNTKIDLVLLDLGLEDTNGLDTFRNFKKMIPDIPVIIITGSDESLALQALKEGAEDFIKKDKINASMLIRILTHTLERVSLQSKTRKYAEQVKKSEQRIRQIIENDIDGIIIVDEVGIVRFVNPAAEHLLNKSSDDLIGTEYGYPLVTGATTELDITGNENRIVEMRVIETSWNQGSAYLACLRDITERKASENELIRAKDEIKVALVELKENQSKLIEYESLKSVKEMSGAISHEFSQPLQALSNYICLIEEHGPDPTYILKCKEMIKRTSELLDDLQRLVSLKRKDYQNAKIIDIKASTLREKNISTNKILVVDDEPDVQESIVDFLIFSGYNCFGADNGIEALKKMEQHDFRLIICDINMPEMNGPDFFNVIQKQKYPGFFIFLTGYEISDVHRKSIMKADAILNKPVSLTDLVKIVKKMVNKLPQKEYA